MFLGLEQEQEKNDYGNFLALAINLNYSNKIINHSTCLGHCSMVGSSVILRTEK